MNTDQETVRHALENLLDTPQDVALEDRFPIEVGGVVLGAEEVIELLLPFLTERRATVLKRAVSGRTYSVIPVVEGLVNVGNVSAVIRSVEAMGYQEFQVVTGENEHFKRSERTSQGAEKWLDLKTWRDPANFAKDAHRRGYSIITMHVDEDAVPLNDIDFTKKTAVVFGNEASGVSEEMLSLADKTCVIPLAGLTESFNVSVAAAITLYHAQQQRIEKLGSHADLPGNLKIALLADFYLRSLGDSASSLLRRLVDEREKR